MSSARRNGLVAIAVLVAVVALFVLLRPGSSDEDGSRAAAVPSATGEPGAGSGGDAPKPAPAPEPIPEVVIEGGQPVGGPLEIEADEGDTVRFAVDSDVDEEIHVHGFDISKDVRAGQRVKVAFDAEFTGIFEVELEQSAVPIAEIQINP